MREFRFKTVDQVHSVYEELDGCRFECEGESLDSVHWLSPENYQTFVTLLGYPKRTNVKAAIH